MATPKMPAAVLDIETDPFKAGRIPKPFCCGFYDGLRVDTWWGDDCISQMAASLRRRNVRFCIFAHNGGRFDFHMLYEELDNPVTIISGRIVRAAAFGKHYLQDSFSIIPVPLHYGGGKLEIDYAKMERGKRERHKAEILKYLRADLVALFEFVTRFEEDFSRRLTVGSTAMRELRAVHEFGRMTRSEDKFFRQFYYGGRVEAFEPGDHKGPWRVYDVRSMYPFVMAYRSHPVNCQFEDWDRLPSPSARRVYFADIEATSKGALPVRADGGIDFPHGRHRFLACSHEIEAARRLGLLQVHKVHWVKVAAEKTRFKKFVEHFYRLRKLFRERGDIHGELFCKFMLNSAYGKFGTSIENLYDWHIKRPPGEDAEARRLVDERNPPQGGAWSIYSTCEAFDLYRRPAANTDRALYDVSIAASITSAARAVLLEGLHHARRPIYCDTDSIICRSLDAIPDRGELGDWQLETVDPKSKAKVADRVAIAGKKLYALAVRRGGRLQWCKVRSKGGRITGRQVAAVAGGATVDYEQDAPTYSASLGADFIKRQFKPTVDGRRKTPR